VTALYVPVQRAVVEAVEEEVCFFDLELIQPQHARVQLLVFQAVVLHQVVYWHEKKMLICRGVFLLLLVR
jgi:hypothetical protein